MRSFFFFNILAILSNVVAIPFTNNLDDSDYVAAPGFVGVDKGIVAVPDCGALKIKCCLGHFNPVTHYVGPPCGTCNVPRLISSLEVN